MAVTNTGEASTLNPELALAAMNIDDVSLSKLKSSIKKLIIDYRREIREDDEDVISKIASYMDKAIIKFDMPTCGTVNVSVFHTSTLTECKTSIKHSTRFDHIWSEERAVFIKAQIMYNLAGVPEDHIIICIGGYYGFEPEFVLIRVNSAIFQIDEASGDIICRKLIEHCQNFIKAKHGLLEIDPDDPF